MAYNAKSLSRSSFGAAYDAGVQKSVGLYIYATTDAAATVETAGYFNDARARLKLGDQILASMVLGGTPVAKHYIVTAVPGAGNVTIAMATPPA